MMNEGQIQEIVERAIVKAFRDLGIQGQSDDEVFQVRRDLLFLREWRLTCEQVRSKGTFALAGIIITAMTSLLVLGAKNFFH